MAPMQENNAKRRGRPAGSTSFQKIKLSDLTSNLGPNASVMVSKKWLDTIGFEVVDTKTTEVQAVANDSLDDKIQFVVS